MILQLEKQAERSGKTFKCFLIAAQIQKKKLFYLVVPSARGEKEIPLSV